MRVAVAMSGGVDSAVAAALLVDAGHDVSGVHLALARDPRSYRTGARGCCSLEDVHDARRAADRIGIPFYVWDLSERFHDEIIEPFIAEYAAGRTPNPCLRCNEIVKFEAMLVRSRALGFDALATGHYARLLPDNGQQALLRARDTAKDQSYVLGGLVQDQLARCMFPLGEFTKTEVREQAQKRDLLVADKPDSTDICFIPDGDTGAFLAGVLGNQPGTIVDETGREVGVHDGAYRFTVGQRRGLRLGRPSQDHQPRYVTGVDVATRTVRVGPRESLAVTSLRCGAATWTRNPHPGEWACLVQVRAHGAPASASVRVSDDAVTVTLGSPILGVAPGQRAVFYFEDEVVGAATIQSTA